MLSMFSNLVTVSQTSRPPQRTIAQRFSALEWSGSSPAPPRPLHQSNITLTAALHTRLPRWVNICRTPTRARFPLLHQHRKCSANDDPSLFASLDEISLLCRRVVHDSRVLPGKFNCVPQSLFLIGTW
jgi:hypothetical protein